MSNKKLTILGILAVLMVLWAGMQSRISNRIGVEPDRLTYLIQGLDPSVVDSIVIGTGEDAFTLKRQGSSFVVANKDNYEVTFTEVVKLELIKGFLGYELEILASDKKHRFKLGSKDEYFKCMSTLQPLVGDKLIVS